MLKKLTAYSLATVIMGAGQMAFAHTGVKDQATEGKSLYTAFTIGHGCGSIANPTQLPVIAQSALFPNAADSVAYKLDANGKDGAVFDLSKAIVGVVGGGVTTLGPKAVMDKSLFTKLQSIIPDASTGVVRGFRFSGGSLPTDMIGLPPFKVSGISFQKTSCAKSLKVRIAIANFCQTTRDTNYDRRVDLWMGHMTTLFNDPDVMPENFATSPYWPTLTVNRDLVANPLPAACTNGGFDVAVEPSDADIDNNLVFPGYWPSAAYPAASVK